MSAIARAAARQPGQLPLPGPTQGAGLPRLQPSLNQPGGVNALYPRQFQPADHSFAVGNLDLAWARQLLQAINSHDNWHT